MKVAAFTKSLFAAFTVPLLLASVSCHSINDVPDFCQREGRQIPDLEKMTRVFTDSVDERGNVGYFGNPLSEYIKAKVRDIHDKNEVNRVVRQFLSDNPHFARVVARVEDRSGNDGEFRSDADLQHYQREKNQGYYGSVVYHIKRDFLRYPSSGYGSIPYFVSIRSEEYRERLAVNGMRVHNCGTFEKDFVERRFRAGG